MLTQEDLKNIGELIDIKLTFLENRIDAKMDARFAGMDMHFSAIETRLDTLENRLDSLENRFNALEARFDALEESVSALSESLEEVRCTVNVLAAWADKTSKIVKVAL